jgi:hypothetical protein
MTEKNGLIGFTLNRFFIRDNVESQFFLVHSFILGGYYRKSRRMFG